MPDYYSDSIYNWYKIKEYMTDYQTQLSNQLLWYNKHCKVDGKSILNLDLLRLGMWTAQDLFQDGNIIPFATWQARGANISNYLAWRNLIACIPKKMKQHIQNNESNSIIYPTLGNKDKIIKILDATEK